MRTLCAFTALLCSVAPYLPAQPATAHKPLPFEITSVKPSKPDARGGGIRPLPGGQSYKAEAVPLRLMMKLMYKITDSQIVGGPAWMDNDLWDVDAKAERPSNLDQLHEMFQTLLADRFQLRFHKETRELAAYVMTVDKSGSKLKTSQSQDWTDIPINPAGPGKIVGTRVPIPYFCWFVAQPLNTPVVDHTGLNGFYDFTLEIPPPPPPTDGAPNGREMAPQDRRENVFAAIREQLGLKLESHKAPVEVFVIDHVEKPTEN